MQLNFAVISFIAIWLSNTHSW